MSITLGMQLQFMICQLCEDLDESQQVNGAYRELTDILLELADLFISIEETFGEKSHILHFSDDKYHFHVTCGADSVPFGKMTK